MITLVLKNVSYDLDDNLINSIFELYDDAFMYAHSGKVYLDVSDQNDIIEKLKNIGVEAEMVWDEFVNTTSKQYVIEIEATCKILNYEFVLIKVVLSSNNIPEISADNIILFYGATKWIDNIYQNNIWNPGVYFTPNAHFETWIEKYKEAAFNYGAEITTLNKL